MCFLYDEHLTKQKENHLYCMQIPVSFALSAENKNEATRVTQSFKEILGHFVAAYAVVGFAALVFCSLQNNFKRTEIAFRLGAQSLS